MLIGDEVFADFAFDPGAAVSVLETSEAVVCSLGGLSKTVGLPQVKLAWIGFGGPDANVADVMAAFELIADTYLSVSTPVQVALPDLLRDGAHVRAQIVQRVAANLSLLQEAVARTPAVTLLPVEAGWSAVLRVPSYQSEESLVLQLLTEEHVFVHPGFFFDFDRESFLVVSLLTTAEAVCRRDRPRAGTGLASWERVVTKRASGVLVPLFSLRSSNSWGVGEFPDLPAFAGWAQAAGQSFIQILPITEVPPSETSPYSALTAMAVDPIYIRLLGRRGLCSARR